MKLTLYHNPRCSKSRETLELLRRRGVEPRVVEYLKEPPSESTLRRLLKQLGVPARALLRTGEPEYRELGLDDPSLDDSALVRAMAHHPRLIQRPIAVCGDRAALGRPPGNVLRLLRPR